EGPMQRLLSLSLAAKLSLMSLALFVAVGAVGVIVADRAMQSMLDRDLKAAMLTAARVSAHDVAAAFPEMSFTVDASGEVGEVTWDAIPDFADHGLADRATLQTGA